MAGVGEASAIVGLVATAAQLSKAVYDIGSKYSNAKKEIQSFGRDVGTLGQVLNQFDRILSEDPSIIDPGVRSTTFSIVDQCRELFGDLERFREALYTRPGAALRIRDRVKWVFQASELQYLQSQVDSMKINLLLMMTLHRRRSQHEFVSLMCFAVCRTVSANDKYRIRSGLQETVDEHTQQVEALAADSSAYVQRLQYLEEQLLDTHDDLSDTARNRMSINIVPTAHSAQSTRDSILNLYGWEEYRHIIWDPREANIRIEHTASADLDRASILIEDYLVMKNRQEETELDNMLTQHYLSTDDEKIHSDLEILSESTANLDPRSISSSGLDSVEIFKSFRVRTYYQLL